MIHMMKTKTLPIRLSEEEHQAIKREAYQRNISCAEVIRLSVKLFIERYTVPKREK